MAEREIETTFKPNPTQRNFIVSKAKADFWASRMGEGKSAGLSWAAFHYARHNPGSVWAMIRDTWENLRATTQEEFFKWFPPGVYGDYHHTKKEYTWAEGVAQGKVVWLGLDDPDDISKMQSRKIDGFGLDEPVPALNSGGIPEPVFDMCFSRSRDPGMKWYPVKLAANNPDESHWTYRRFVDPGTPDFRYWQAAVPENEANLRPGYYANLRSVWAHRPDFIQRFVDGKFGFTPKGKAVTPEWRDEIHLAVGLGPVKGCELYCLWDFGLNPTCVISQITPTRQWIVPDAFVGDGIGVAELCETWARPILAAKYRGFSLTHIGDPAGEQREQSTSKMSAARMVLTTLGGKWRAGPRSLSEGIEPLRAVLKQNNLLLVDRANARPVWLALRGGWHYHVARTGVISTAPAKNMDSHPGDAMRYGAGVLFPLAKRDRRGQQATRAQVATYFGQPQPGAKKRKPGTLDGARPGQPEPVAGSAPR